MERAHKTFSLASRGYTRVHVRSHARGRFLNSHDCVLVGGTSSYTKSPLWLDIPFVNQIVVPQIVSIACGCGATAVGTTSSIWSVDRVLYRVRALARVFKTCSRSPHVDTRARSVPPPLGCCVLLLLHSSITSTERILLVPVVVLTVVCYCGRWLRCDGVVHDIFVMVLSNERNDHQL